MLISYPVLPTTAVHDDEDIYLANILEGHVLEHEGRYPVSTIDTAHGPMHRWHGGLHLYGGGEPIRAIADGMVVACRFAAQCETYGELGAYDTSFVLLRHETKTGDGTTVVFYSLYMHLASQASLAADRLSQLPAWLRQSTGPSVRRLTDQRVWRKEVLGFAGQLYNREAMHFEVFMLDADFNRVWRDSSAVTQGMGSDDWFGDAHFVIPPQQQFADRHPRAAATGAHRIDLAGRGDYPLQLGQAGKSDQALYVSVNLSAGRRTATTYRSTADGGYERLGPPVVQDDYEYELYRLATALYPDCPSAGLEWLRFGRVLGPDRTTRNENWQLIRYSETAIGYVNLAPNSIVKLSDADFPHWLGWEKREEGEAANAADGVCDDGRTIALSQAADEASTRKLRHLVCRAPTEWDTSELGIRYARLRAPGQSLENPRDWNEFEQHVAKLAFWSEAGLSERSVWHFHPLQFIRHFRNCGWLSRDEFAQCIPRRNLHLHGASFTPQLIANWGTALSRAGTWSGPLSRATRKYGISNTRRRLRHFLAQLTEESGYYRLVVEGNGEGAPYAPYYGRGLIQITHQGNYVVYGAFRALSNSSEAGVPLAQFQPLGWNPDLVIAKTDHQFNAENCADSAAFYWICPTIIATGINCLRTSDGGETVESAVASSRSTNGNVPLQNINGLATRLQAFLYIGELLEDSSDNGRRTTHLAFSWRRNSNAEILRRNGQPILLPNGQPKKGFVLGAHSIEVPMERQRP